MMAMHNFMEKEIRFICLSAGLSLLSTTVSPQKISRTFHPGGLDLFFQCKICLLHIRTVGSDKQLKSAWRMNIFQIAVVKFKVINGYVE